MVNAIASWVEFGYWGERVLSMVGIGIHWGILQYVLGLPFAAFILQLIYLKNKDKDYLRIAKTLVKGMAIVFAVGAATGTLVEFGLIVVWPNVLTAVGKWLYFPMYAEVFAFIMEAMITYLLYYGWDKFSDVTRTILTFFAFIGPWYSGAMILSANAYMNVPTGLLPDYNATTGQWLYSLGYPKILLDVPSAYVSLLNVSKLESLGMTIQGTTSNGVLVYMPVSIVNRLVYESFNSYIVNQSILKAVLNNNVLTNQAVLQTPVLNIVNNIMDSTVNYYGIYTYLFDTPDFIPALLHSIGAGLVVTGFTMIAGFGTRYLKVKDEKYKKYLEKALKFSIVFSLIVIIYEGLIAGDMMGKTVAKYNPEKFAAIEGTMPGFTSIASLFHLDKIEAFLAYGSFSAKLPNYSQIPQLWGQLGSFGVGITSYLPPLIVDYTYYAMVFVGVLLGIYALILTGYLIFRGVSKIHKFWLYLAIPGAILAQFASLMGWGTREIGRLPWIVYGVMTLNVGSTLNQPTIWEDVVVSLFYIAIVIGLVYAVYRFLWVPSKKEILEEVK
ncbi:cytochrome bd-type quinol oxidase, subunit 1 [Caldisphaera lagunensis DSM 15908]|uniref:Cytochrome bd-type quinol oxidase, subunit 1 n=1 Tax=Caldisphaera lagunensis (strain DSM 15908 / JCM 11604 / ANMR 0165 / IC-154) TaxID=1056495 RepID=L0AAR3_CALLD|nr:cytochrome ubiquinol oxidase subunit I [Caldisphaera lagunensis]AFZ70207.1 cytochrome bd-type quinol oxidase, subunit 1 [Caldisphaera lagunensis DSM 15908]